MFQMPFCLMIKGPALTDGTRSLLAKTANDLLLGQEKKCHFKGDSAEGVVETDFQPAIVGTFSGIVFHGFLETDRGKTKVDFIIQPQKEFPAKIFWTRLNPAQARNAQSN